MRSAYIFNPDNDLALANGADNYTAPKMARKIRDDLQLIPLWFADTGSTIIADCDTVNEAFVADTVKMFPQLGAVDLSHRDADCAMPWGWSRAIRSELKRLNVANLPDKLQLDAFRQLSHRRTSVEILSEIDYRGIMPSEYFSLSDVQRYVSLHGETVVKAPWSCSGRGVFLVNQTDFDRSGDLIAGIISKQGSVMCEKFLNKQSDDHTDERDKHHKDCRRYKNTLSRQSVAADIQRHFRHGSNNQNFGEHAKKQRKTLDRFCNCSVRPFCKQYGKENQRKIDQRNGAHFKKASS